MWSLALMVGSALLYAVIPAGKTSLYTFPSKILRPVFGDALTHHDRTASWPTGTTFSTVLFACAFVAINILLLPPKHTVAIFPCLFLPFIWRIFPFYRRALQICQGALWFSLVVLCHPPLGLATRLALLVIAFALSIVSISIMLRETEKVPEGDQKSAEEWIEWAQRADVTNWPSHNHHRSADGADDDSVPDDIRRHTDPYYFSTLKDNTTPNPDSRGCRCLGRFKRRPEVPFRVHCRYIAEFWNTVSNAGFLSGAVVCLVVLFRQTLTLSTAPLIEIKGPVGPDTLATLIVLLFMAGICSAIHHSLCDRYDSATLVLDWLPIASSIFLILFCTHDVFQCWLALSYRSVFLLILAISVLLQDHVLKLGKPPWGHVAWHILAANAVTSAYLDFIHALHN